MISAVGYRIVVAGSYIYRYLLAWWDWAVDQYYVRAHQKEIND